MRVEVRLSVYGPPPLTDPIIARLRSVAPPHVDSRTSPWWRFDESDPKLARMFDMLAEFGLGEGHQTPPKPEPVWSRVLGRIRAPRQQSTSAGEKASLQVTRLRSYEPPDYVGLNFVEPRSSVRITDRGRTDDGRIQLDFFDVKKMSPEAREAALLTCGVGLLVPTRIKKRLETAGFEGMVFRETVPSEMIDDDHSREQGWTRAGIEPLWEWSSNVLMPWIALHQPLEEVGTRRPLSGDERRTDLQVWLSTQPTFNQAERTYAKQDLAAATPPVRDAALTRERTWPHPSLEARKLIVAARVRDWWLAEGLVADNWTPVRVVG